MLILVFFLKKLNEKYDFYSKSDTLCFGQWLIDAEDHDEMWYGETKAGAYSAFQSKVDLCCHLAVWHT